MATTLRCRSATTNGPISGNAYDFTTGQTRTLIGGSAVRMTGGSLDAALGAGVKTLQSNTVAGPTTGIEMGNVGTSGRIEFISAPLAADVTISGNITVDFWALESSMAANAAIGCIIYRLDSTGAVVSEIGRGIGAAELGTSAAVSTFTITPTSTNMLKGDRIRVVAYMDDAPALTMASGASVTFDYDGTTNAADGDSKVTFTEDITFITADPTGSQIFPTNTASAVSTASVDREAWTSRGAGVQNDVTNCTNSPAAPIHVTDTAGGTVVDWFTRELNAFTLGGAVLVNVRALESSGLAGAAVRCQIAVVNSDGTGAVVWGEGQHYTETGLAEAAEQFFVAGADTSVTDGKRLRIRLYTNNYGSGTQQASQTVTTFYAGTSGGASGDMYLTFTQTLTEFGGVVDHPHKPHRVNLQSVPRARL